MMISIIVPVYNGEDYIEECVRSIMEQIYQKLQIILVDDGSEDDSLEICHKLEREDSRIEVISQSNQGVSAARNTGLFHAKGKWIAFVDADDRIMPDFITVFGGFLQQDYDICIGEEVQDRNSRQTGVEKAKILDRREFFLFERGLLNKYAVKKSPHLTSACGKLYSRNFLEKHNLLFDKDLKKSEDALFNQYAFHYAVRGVYVPKRIYYYRKRKGSASSGYEVNSVGNYIRHLELIKQFLIMENIFEEMKNDYCYREIFHFFYCIDTDFCHKDNPGSYKKRKKEYLSVLEIEPFKSAFRSGKCKEFILPEKILFYCVKYKLFFAVELMFRLKNLLGVR